MGVNPRTAGPLTQGKEVVIFDETPTAAGSKTVHFNIDADTILVSLQASAISGSLEIQVYTEGSEGEDLLIIDFPAITAPTTNLLLRKAAAALQRIKVVATYTGACSFIVRGRGIGTGEASVRLLGANDAVASQTDVTTTTGLVISAGITDRSGMVVKNNSTTGTIYLGFTAAQAALVVGYPLGPQEALGLDIGAGVELYGTASAGTVDVRILEAGG